MKRILTGLMLALPLAVVAMPKQASALEVIVNPRLDTHTSREVFARRVEHRRWIPGHWERRDHRRIWIPGHYERY